jgi:hypothetical protein
MKDKHYGEVQCLHFDRHGNGPLVSQVAVRANIDPNLHYPNARIYVGAWGENAGEMDFGGNGLLLADAIALVKMLKEAIADVTRACPALAVPTVSVDDLVVEGGGGN